LFGISKFNVFLLPKILWDKKVIIFCLGTLWKENFILFYFTSYTSTPSTSNFDSMWPRGEFLFKIGCIFIFPIFDKELLYIATWLKLPKGWRSRCQKRSLLCPRFSLFSLFFFFFHCSIWCFIQYDCSNLNVKSLVFFKKFYKFYSVGIFSQDLVNKENSNSLILTSLREGFEPYALDLF
jgi:hypothetical protein